MIKKLIVSALFAVARVGAADFAADIKPVLETTCLQCHGPDKDKGKLRLHEKAAFMHGGDTGAAVVAGKPDESLLLKRVQLPEDDDDAMPPKGKGPRLTAAQVTALREWIAAGAPWPDGLVLKPVDPASVISPKDGENLVSIQVFPPACGLETKRDAQRLVVMARYADDTTRDVTKKVTWQIGNPALVKQEGNEFKPLADGESTIRAAFFDKVSEVPLKVTGASADRAVSFRLDVMPVFERSGCNTGSCHGAARGQDGFRLSLFGFDPKSDYHRITRELGSRRINLAIPEESLLVEKINRRGAAHRR